MQKWLLLLKFRDIPRSGNCPYFMIYNAIQNTCHGDFVMTNSLPSWSLDFTNMKQWCVPKCVSCEFEVSLTICCCHRFADGNIVIKWTALDCIWFMNLTEWHSLYRAIGLLCIHITRWSQWGQYILHNITQPYCDRSVTSFHTKYTRKMTWRITMEALSNHENVFAHSRYTMMC